MRLTSASPRALVESRRGFTIVELMIVVVIVAVLATVAIPVYGRYIKYSRVSEATTRIGEIVTAAKAYAQQNTDAAGNPRWPPAAGGGLVSLTAGPSFSYSITAGAGANARTTALRVRATGRNGTKMRGVTVQVTVPNITAGASATTVTGL